MDEDQGNLEFEDGRFLQAFWGRSTSEVWNYFKFEVNHQGVYIDRTAVYCLVCCVKMKYCGNTTNMANHLLRKHPGFREVEWVDTSKDVHIKLEKTEEATVGHLGNFVGDNGDIGDTELSNTVKLETLESTENDNMTILASFWGDCCDRVWEYFKFEVDEDGNYINKDISVCTLCESRLFYAGNLVTLQTHLDSKHPDLQCMPRLKEEEMEERVNAGTSHEEYVKSVVETCAKEVEIENGSPDKEKIISPIIGKRFYKSFWGNAVSIVWDHFQFEADEDGKYISKNVVYCKHCDAKLKYCHNTTNMGYHLERWHKIARKTPTSQAKSTKTEANRLFVDKLRGCDAVKHNELVRVSERQRIPVQRPDQLPMRPINRKRIPKVFAKKFLNRHFTEDGDIVTEEPKQFRTYWGNCVGTIWRYFLFQADEAGNYVDRTAVYCTLCGIQLKYLGAIGFLKQHLRQRHFDQYVNVSSEGVEDAKEYVGGDELILQSIAEHFIADLRPMSDIDSPSFRKMCLDMCPKLILPHRLKFKQEILTSIYVQKKTRFISEISKAGRHSLTVDWWKSEANQDYVTFTIHYISDNWYASNKTIQTWPIGERPTPHELACKLSSLVQDWQLKDPVIVTDNSYVMNEATNNILNWLNVSAINYVVDQSVKKVFSLPSVHEMLSKVRNIFAQLQQVTHNVQIKQKQAKLQLPERDLLKVFDESRWTVTLDMLMLFVEQWPLLQDIIIDLGFDHSLILSPTSFKNLREDLIEILKVIRMAMAYMSPDRQHTVSVIMPMIIKLKNCLKPSARDNAFGVLMKQTMSEVIENSYKKQDIQMLLKKASALDPRMKKLHFLSSSEQDEVKEVLCEEAMALAQEDVATQQQTDGESGDNLPEETCIPQPKKLKMTEPSMSDWLGDIVSVKGDHTLREKIDAEMTLFLCEPDVKFDDNPLKWWQDKWSMYPLLSPLVRWYMCIPAVCVDMDKNVKDKRRCLQSDTANMQLFLQQQL